MIIEVLKKDREQQWKNGRQEGEKIGERRGEARGEKIGIAKTIAQMVKEMIKNNISDEQIIKIAKIDQAELERLKMA